MAVTTAYTNNLTVPAASTAASVATHAAGAAVAGYRYTEDKLRYGITRVNRIGNYARTIGGAASGVGQFVGDLFQGGLSIGRRASRVAAAAAIGAGSIALAGAVCAGSDGILCAPAVAFASNFLARRVAGRAGRRILGPRFE